MNLDRPLNVLADINNNEGREMAKSEGVTDEKLAVLKPEDRTTVLQGYGFLGEMSHPQAELIITARRAHNDWLQDWRKKIDDIMIKRPLIANEQQEVDADANALEKSSMPYLANRLQYGLDPASMMEVPGVKELAAAVVQALAQDANPEAQAERWIEVKSLIEKLHKEGPWGFADRLNASPASDVAIRAYIVFAEACAEHKMNSLVEYLRDKTRVRERFATFTADAFDERKAAIANKIEGLHEEKVTIGKNEVTIPVANGDPAFPLAMRGYKGCVVDANGLFFVQTSTVPDSVLSAEGLAPGFGEVYDATLNGMKRVPLNTEKSRTVWVQSAEVGTAIESMKPAVKRIAGGYVLAYDNQALALNIAARCLAPSEEKA